MVGKICNKCGSMSPKFKNEDEAIEAGWVWGKLNFINGSVLNFAICPEHGKEEIPYLKAGWAHYADVPTVLVEDKL